MEAKLDQFKRDGYVVLENFITDTEADQLRTDCYNLIEDMNPAQHQTVFSTTKQLYRDNYFLESADKIGFFFEEGALDAKGELTVDKQKSLNKIGHALHVLSPNYKKVTHCEKVKNVARTLELKKPTICQSMYIFKQPKIGGEVICHQDATFLYTEPPVKVIGLWIALEDATLENGCLWFMPGSHKDGVLGNYRMILNPDKTSTQTCVFTGEKQEYDQSKFVPAPVKKGDCVVIDGLVVHKSERNTSERSRHIYTFHMFDRESTQWSDGNWLQPTDKGTFTDLYSTNV